MGLNFSPFEIGRRALLANQYGLNITGQNIANVNTPGYTRQAPVLVPSPAVGSGKVQLGTGVSVVSVKQFRDRFVETRLETETGIAGRLTSQRDALTPVDAAFDESEGNGISANISAFFGSFRALESNPVSVPLRNDVIVKANSMTGAFANTRSRLTQIRSDTDQLLRSRVDQVNQLSQKVADLNVRIANAENTGGTASELRDQRNEMGRQLTELTGARSVETDKMVTMTLPDGQALVLGEHVQTLQTQNTLPDGMAALMLNGQPVTLTEGTLQGLTNAITFTTSQITALDDLAASITSRVNALHVSGTDAYGNAGVDFFQVPAVGSVTAANFSVSTAVAADSRLIVASPLAIGSSSGTVAGAIAELLTDPNSTSGSRSGSFSSIYSSIVRDTGSALNTVDNALVTQQAIVAQAVAQRDATSGVSLDEEAINLMQYQKAYEAAAKFLRVADEMTQAIMSVGS